MLGKTTFKISASQIWKMHVQTWGLSLELRELVLEWQLLIMLLFLYT